MTFIYNFKEHVLSFMTNYTVVDQLKSQNGILMLVCSNFTDSREYLAVSWGLKLVTEISSQ